MNPFIYQVKKFLWDICKKIRFRTQIHLTYVFSEVYLYIICHTY